MIRFCCRWVLPCGYAIHTCLLNILALQHTQVLQILDKWQPTRRNKVESTGLLLQVEELSARLSERSEILAKNLTTRWQELPIKYTIPRKEIAVSSACNLFFVTTEC